MKKNAFFTIVFLYLPLVFWLSGIYVLSAVPGSGQVYEMPKVMYLERKGAHVFEYFVLTVLFLRVFLFHLSENKLRAVLLSILFSLSYAISDETHQMFVFGRTGKATDILIDSIGIALAVGSWYLWRYRKKNDAEENSQCLQS